VIDPLLVQQGALRRFADANIQSTIDKVLAEQPSGARGAVIAHADGSGLSLSTVVGRTGAGWSVVAVVRKPWKGKVEAEAALRYAW
jgi:hypothetical protein